LDCYLILRLLAGQFVHNVNQSIAFANGRRSKRGTLNYIWIIQPGVGFALINPSFSLQYRGPPKGYIEALEVRLVKTEQLLLQTLSFLSPDQIAIAANRGNSISDSWQASNSNDGLYSDPPERSPQKLGVAYWKAFPLQSAEDVQRWWLDQLVPSAPDDDADANLRYQGSVDNAGNGLAHAAAAPSFTGAASNNVAWLAGSRSTHSPMAPKSQVDESRHREGASRKGFSADANILRDRQIISGMVSTSVPEISDGNPGYMLHASQISQAAKRSRQSSESSHSEQPEGDIYW
jgi:hypothetical protein